MKKQTAVEWLMWEMSKLGLLPGGVPDQLYQKAKAMEKEQMINAFDNGEACWYDDFSDYYISTYES
jgi:hypothetical protein